MKLETFWSVKEGNQNRDIENIFGRFGAPAGCFITDYARFQTQPDNFKRALIRRLTTSRRNVVHVKNTTGQLRCVLVECFWSKTCKYFYSIVKCVMHRSSETSNRWQLWNDELPSHRFLKVSTSNISSVHVHRSLTPEFKHQHCTCRSLTLDTKLPLTMYGNKTHTRTHTHTCYLKLFFNCLARMFSECFFILSHTSCKLHDPEHIFRCFRARLVQPKPTQYNTTWNRTLSSSTCGKCHADLIRDPETDPWPRNWPVIQ